MEQGKTGATLAVTRQQNEVAMREAVQKAEIRKWCVEQTVKFAVSIQSPITGDVVRAILHIFHDFVTNKENTDGKAS